MSTNKKQIKDFNLLTGIVGNHDNILLQRDNGTTFRTHVNNLPFTNKDYTSAGLATLSYVNNKNVAWNKITDTPTTLAGYGITDGGSGAGTSGLYFYSLTRNELVALQSTNGLSAGSFYMITDFKTCYDRPDFDYNGMPITTGNYHEGEVEPIILLATSNNTFDINAYQPKYPKDTIKYDINWNFTEVSGTHALGRITERVDEYNNRTDYDHRNILFKRYRSYFFDSEEELNGKINVSEFTVTGIGTSFTSGLTEGVILFIQNDFFKVETIIDDTNMIISGHHGINVSNAKYYFAEPEIDDNASSIPYTHTQMSDDEDEASTSSFAMNGHVANGEIHFGENSEYFTNLYPGLFTLAAYNISIDEFSIVGGLGADGSGTLKTYNYSTSFNDIDYTVFVKKVYGAGDPSVNHIIILNANATSGLTQTVGNTTDSDLHSIYNIKNSGATQLFYILTAKPDGAELTDLEVSDMVNAYLGLINIININATLTELNNNYLSITSIPDEIFFFSDFGDLGMIDDGGDDMYDSGNYIFTNLGSRWTCNEWKQNNIIDDNIYRLFKTFQYETEIAQDNFPVSKNNYIGNNSNVYLDEEEDNTFMLANNVIGLFSHSNKIGDRSINNTTFSITNNVIGNKFRFNITFDDFDSNIIGVNCYSNIITNEFFANQIGNNFNNNKIYSDFGYNIINDEFTNNYIFSEVMTNKIDKNFNSNFIYDSFYENSVLIGFENNIIYSNFNNNNIKNYYRNNTIHNNFNLNIIGDNCTDNTIFHNLESNIIGDTFQSNTFGSDGGAFYTFSHNNIFNRAKGNFFLGDVYQNTIGVDFFANNILGTFDNNVIGHFTIFNNLGNSFYNNNINNGFQGNTIGENFESNTLGYNFSGNNIGINANGNVIGINAYNNHIIDNFLNNTIENNFLNNTIGSGFRENIIGYNFYNNTIGDGFKLNNMTVATQSIDYTTSTHVYADYTCNIIKGVGGLFLNYFDGTSGIYTAPTA